MEERIKSILHKIHLELDDNHQNKSLLGGATGISLYQFLYYKHFKEGEFDDTFTNSLQELIEDATKIESSAFAGGKSGINWYYSFLFNNDILENKDFELLTNDDERLAFASIHYLRNDYYDLLHGGLSIARQLLYAKSDVNLPFFNQVFEELSRIFSKGNDIFRHFDIQSGRLDLQKTNLGLSHGIAGILKFCLECYSKNICVDQAYQYANKIVQFLIYNTQKENKNCFFTSISDDNLTEQLPSRLAWCYGDLGTCYILFQAGKLLNNEGLKNFALEALLHSTNRTKYEDTRVVDAGFCHGSAGIAYIYKRLWRETNDIVFSNACDFWIERTIEYSKYPDGVAGFKTYDIVTSTLQTDPSLLEGASGIGLVLLSYLTDDFCWDYCVMMNDLEVNM